MKFKFSFLSILMSCFLAVGIPLMNLNTENESKNVIVKDYNKVEIPDTLISTNNFSKNTDKVFSDYANITDVVFAKAKIERRLINIPNNDFYGGEIIQKGTEIKGYTFEHDSRILKVTNSEVLIDLLDSTCVMFNISLSSFPIEIEKTKITTYFDNKEVPFENTPAINFVKEKLEYQISLNIHNDGNIFNGDQIKAEIITSSCYIKGLLVNNAYIHDVNGKKKIVVSTFYNGKEYCEYRDIEIIKTIGSISVITGDNIKAGLKVYKLK